MTAGPWEKLVLQINRLTPESQQGKLMSRDAVWGTPRRAPASFLIIMKHKKAPRHVANIKICRTTVSGVPMQKTENLLPLHYHARIGA